MSSEVPRPYWSGTKDGRYLNIPGEVGVEGLRTVLRDRWMAEELVHAEYAFTDVLIDTVKKHVNSLFQYGGLITSNGQRLETPFISLGVSALLEEEVRKNRYLTARPDTLLSADSEWNPYEYVEKPEQMIHLVTPGINKHLILMSTKRHAATFWFSMPDGKKDKGITPLQASIEKHIQLLLAKHPPKDNQGHLIHPVFSLPTIMSQTLVDLIPAQKS